MNRFFVSIAAAFVCLLASVPLLAQSPGSCSGTCACTSTEIDDYGNCTIITESGMMDTMDPGEVASVTNLTATYNSTTGEVDVEVDIDEPAGVVIPVNDYNGDWPDLATLQGYVDELFDGQVPTASLPDLCTRFLGYDTYTQAGAIARWDPATGDWATNQTQNVILAAITAEDGSLLVDGTQVIGVPVLNEGCLTVTDGLLSGETCSRIEGRAIDYPEFCREEREQSVTLDIAVAEEREIKWNGFETEVEYSGSLQAGTLRFEVKRVLADEIGATALWYDGGTYAGQEATPPILNDDYAGISRKIIDGVCTSPGYAEREQTTAFGTQLRDVSGETRAGTAPVSCPEE